MESKNNSNVFIFLDDLESGRLSLLGQGDGQMEAWKATVKYLNEIQDRTNGERIPEKFSLSPGRTDECAPYADAVSDHVRRGAKGAIIVMRSIGKYRKSPIP